MEILVLGGIFLLLFSIGVLSAISEDRAQKRAMKWYVPPTGSITNQNRNRQPIDEASSYGSMTQFDKVIPEFSIDNPPQEIEVKPVEVQEVIATNTSFEHSIVPQEITNNLNVLMNNVKTELNKQQAEGNDSLLSDEMKEKIKGLVGETTSRIVTNLIPDLTENKLAVIMGLYNPSENMLSFEGASIKLSTTKEIISGEDDFILLKGTLLPNGNFRVIHFDDADTVECGYGVESFILPKVA